MRSLLIIGLCLLSSACHNGDSTHRQSYVISKSHQAAVEEETVTEALSE